jgi:hypothetical protein
MPNKQHFEERIVITHLKTPGAGTCLSGRELFVMAHVVNPG